MNSFRDIIGNENVARALQGAILSGRVGHAYCVAGRPGSGKKLISYAFAKALQCEDRLEADSCGVCSSCVCFEAGTHPDVFHIRPQKSTIGVDVVRELVISEIAHRPHRYPYKVFVIEQADTLTVQAQNALLKTLEEPCGYGIFVLVTEKADSLLPTVRSRCLTYFTRPVGVQRIAEYLASHADIAAEDGARIARLSLGSIGRALALASDEELGAIRVYISELAETLRSSSLVECFAQTKELERYKHRISDVFDLLSLRYRDALVVGETGEVARALDVDESRQTLYLREEMLEKLEAIDKARVRLRHNGNFQLVLDSLILTLRNP